MLPTALLTSSPTGLLSNPSALPRQPQDDVRVTLPSPAIGIELVQHPTLQPNQPLALLVDRVLIARRPGRKRRGDRVESGLRDRNADHVRASTSLRSLL